MQLATRPRKDLAFIACFPSELTVGHILWPVTHQSADPWPMTQSQTMAWVDHDYLRIMMSSRVTTIAFYSLQSGILDMAYAVQYTVSPVVYTTILQAEHGEQFFKLFVEKKLCLTSYTFTFHLIMGQVFYGTNPWPTWHIHICRPIWPMTPWPADPLSALLPICQWQGQRHCFLSVLFYHYNWKPICSLHFR